MSKRKGILLTSIAGMGIVVIVGVILVVESVTYANTKISFEADKSISVISSNLIVLPNHDFTEISPQLKKEEKIINDFLTSKIQYKFADQIETVEKDLVKNWITLENDQVILNEEEVKRYVEGLANKYDTVGKERRFVDSHGNVVTVEGGPYGWEIDQKEETKELIRLIQEGKIEEGREPIYKQMALVRGINDIGSTYVEVNMSEQKMWFYKEGELIVSTNIVTGNMAKGHDTPTVVGYIHNKIRNTNLVGTGYVAFVHYWMKVYGSIGIHDASWRNNFGGNIYTTNGSHGCINTPYDNVKMIFDNIEIGTPVIIFYENEME